MSARTIRWCVWLVAVATLPVPYFALAAERAPALRAAFLALIFGAIWIVEGGAQAATAAGLASAQALGWWLGLFVAAWALSVLLARFVEPRLRTRLVVLLCGALIAASLSPIYVTTLSSSRPRSSWSGIFD
jgi:uncharacterized membrane protein